MRQLTELRAESELFSFSDDITRLRRAPSHSCAWERRRKRGEYGATCASRQPAVTSLAAVLSTVTWCRKVDRAGFGTDSGLMVSWREPRPARGQVAGITNFLGASCGSRTPEAGSHGVWSGRRPSGDVARKTIDKLYGAILDGGVPASRDGPRHDWMVKTAAANSSSPRRSRSSMRWRNS